MKIVLVYVDTTGAAKAEVLGEEPTLRDCCRAVDAIASENREDGTFLFFGGQGDRTPVAVVNYDAASRLICHSLLMSTNLQ